MPVLERITRSPEETTALGRELASRLTAPVLVLLSGDLGSGKTTLTKGIVSGLGAAREEDVTSPTFTLVHVFQKNPPVNSLTSPLIAPPTSLLISRMTSRITKRTTQRRSITWIFTASKTFKVSNP